MTRIEGDILNQLELLAHNDVKSDDVVAWIKKELLYSFERGIATAKRDTERRATLPQVKRRTFARQR